MLAQLWLATTLTTTTLSACGHHDYPPWNWLSDGKIIGVCAEVVSTLYQRLGFNVDLSYVGPWARCQQKVAKGEVDINICALRNEERAHYSRFTRTPMAINDMAVFVRQPGSRLLQRREDLTGLRGAMMIGVSLGSEMDGFLQENTRIYRVNSLKQVFGLLASDRVDFVPYGRSSGRLFLSDNYPDSGLADLQWPLQRGELYISVSLQSPHLDTLEQLEPMLQTPGMSQWIDQLLEKYSDLYLQQQRQQKP
ncbi:MULTISPECIES: substrate-binding periplasmic protein [Aeromonas]|uniref:Amino acid-binding protein n=1 Tax=Aeromonas veronii TaxID=654 RepID=A0A2T4N7H7_AERVE|nr:transporter substrate-binding domain-containing protein [Aeromonas veronii]HDT6077170.1 transporter substrate-binding domain-containing protein [Aeromonas veronii bv. veronii]MBL0504529.1 transporter substrate-binding domain-containing protein [Aeromonas veronii]MCR4447010.1 transporter substrate-binding domain-containing protein [Aeromonas veronii]PTH82750.1 amino acid-binding protein [Aeromonas veronii]RDE62124.1 amino acid-binding protein [Aeromonas veronii]